MTAEEIARRFEFRRPDATLIGYDEVGLPFYRIKLRVFTLERKKIDPISEFILRSVQSGLDGPTELGQFLGLNESVVVGALSELQRSEDIHLTAAPGSRRHVWALTPRGTETLNEAERIVEEQGTFDIDFDGLTRRVENFARSELLTPKELRESGLVEIPPHPAKRPELHDVGFPEVATLVRNTGGGRRQLLSIAGIEKRTSLFRKAVALIYQAHHGNRTEIAFVIDGRISEQHEDAFAASPGPEKLGMDTNGCSGIDGLLRSDLLRDLAKKLPAPSDVRTARHRVVEAEERLLQAQAVLNRAETTAEKAAAKKEEEAAAKEAAEAVRAVESYEARSLEVFEHPPILSKALLEARERILIISPWIRAAVVNQFFLERLQRALTRGVDVYIGYGISPEDDQKEFPQDRRAREQLQGLSQRFKKLRFKNLGNTHAKVLAYDCTCLVVTSFNWLSFKGDKTKGFRDEQGILVTDPKMIEEKFASQLARFDAVDDEDDNGGPRFQWRHA